MTESFLIKDKRHRYCTYEGICWDWFHGVSSASIILRLGEPADDKQLAKNCCYVEFTTQQTEQIIVNTSKTAAKIFGRERLEY
jgi:hypothetical protein